MIDMSRLRHRRDFRDGLELDVAIVGAGVSGLYSGCRLLHGRYCNGTSPRRQVQVLTSANASAVACTPSAYRKAT